MILTLTKKQNKILYGNFPFDNTSDKDIHSGSLVIQHEISIEDTWRPIMSASSIVQND